MKWISNQKFTSIILIFLTFIFLSIHQEVFACSNKLDDIKFTMETSDGGACEIKLDPFGAVVIDGTWQETQYIITIMYKADKDQDACPDDEYKLPKFKICVAN